MDFANCRFAALAKAACAITGGLLPIMWSVETGSRVMGRIAAPMDGGMISATIPTLILMPIIYQIWRGWQMRRTVRRKHSRPGIGGCQELMSSYRGQA